MAQPMGLYAKHRLNVDVVKTAGWAGIRDKTINREYDAAHMLSPVPLAISLGLGSQPFPFAVPAIESTGKASRSAPSTRTSATRKPGRGANRATA
jgi:nitrate/nitrite transport system substrate-binding protein